MNLQVDNSTTHKLIVIPISQFNWTSYVLPKSKVRDSMRNKTREFIKSMYICNYLITVFDTILDPHFDKNFVNFIREDFDNGYKYFNSL